MTDYQSALTDGVRPMIKVGTRMLLPVIVVYECEQTEGAFVCVEVGHRRMLVRLSDLKEETKEVNHAMQQ